MEVSLRTVIVLPHLAHPGGDAMSAFAFNIILGLMFQPG